MTAPSHDVCEDSTVQKRTIHAQLNGNDLLYTDDTLLVTTGTRTMRAFREAIEREPAYYIMKLNNGKCLTITWVYSLSLSHTHAHFENMTMLSKVPTQST